MADGEKFDEAGAKSLRYQLLIFSRWCQVMLRFEKSMYEKPEQDLNKLWWDLIEKYQLLQRPEGRDEPDYASKIHIVVAPVYYHNYMMGQLFASQVHHAIARDVYGKTVDHVIAQQVVLADGSEAEFRELDAQEWTRAGQRPGTEGRIYRTVSRVVGENAEEIDRRFPRIMRRVGGYNLDEFAWRGATKAGGSSATQPPASSTRWASPTTLRTS